MEAGTQVSWEAQVVGKQEESSLELLHSHHGLCEVLQVHVSHFGGLGAGDSIVMLHLKRQVTEKHLFFSPVLHIVGNNSNTTFTLGSVFFHVTSDTAQRRAFSLSRAHSLATGPSGKLTRYLVNMVSAACSCELACRATPFRIFLEA